MKKKILAITLCIAMLAIAVVGGTLAYFTDDAMETNTMVIGNVAIDIDEWQYVDNAWEDYEDGKFVLYPLESEQGQLLNNKSVRTYNTSDVPATGNADDYKVYIRSFVLLEKNTELTANFVGESNCCFPGIHLAYDKYDGSSYSWTASKDGKTHYASKEAGHLTETVTVGGKEYWAIWYVAANEDAIPVGAALSSVHSVWMDKNITQEQAAGWGTDGVQIIAFSQGIQETGLTHAEAMEALGVVTVADLEAWAAEAAPQQ